MNPPQQGIKTAVLPIKVGQISLDCHCNIYDAKGRCVADNLWPDDAKNIVTALNNYASIEQENQKLKQQMVGQRRAIQHEQMRVKAYEQENQRLREALSGVVRHLRSGNHTAMWDAGEIAHQALATDTKGGG